MIIPSQLVDIRPFSYEGRLQVNIGAGRCRTEHVVPPAGETYAFDRNVWTHDFTLAVSRTGRSVRLWVAHQEIDLKTLTVKEK